MNIRFFLVGLMIFCSSLGALDLRGQELFAKANEAYKKGDFKEAYDWYKNVRPKSAEIYYNMGNTAYKLNNFGYALLFK